jgi:phosphonate transport system substrate-binding protein
VNPTHDASETGRSLGLANFLSPCLNDFCTTLAPELSRVLGAPVYFDEVASVNDIERGEVDMAFLCGLPYTRIVDRAGPVLMPLVAALVDDPRVAERPVYFSELVVSANSPHRQLADLHGVIFGYNETGSFSGFVNLGAALAGRGLDWHFFGRCIETGSHADSLRMVAGGQIDVAAIDSHALTMEVARDPALRARLRVVESVGPYPMPPLVISSRLGVASRDAIARVLLGLHECQGTVRETMRQCAIVRLAGVSDNFYDPVRDAARSVPPLTR